MQQQNGIQTAIAELSREHGRIGEVIKQLRYLRPAPTQLKFKTAKATLSSPRRTQRRTMSAEARQRISEAVKARWARQRRGTLRKAA